MGMAKPNISSGGIFTILAGLTGLGGMALGAAYDAGFNDGRYIIDISHAFLKAERTHGMAFAPLGFLGAFCFLGSALIMIKGGLKAAGNMGSQAQP